MRNLTTADLFSAMRIIRAANIREDIKPVLRRAAEGKADVQNVGIDSILAFIEILSTHNAETAIYEFLAGPWEQSAEEIQSMQLEEFCQKLEDFAASNDLKDFFKRVSRLITSK